MISSEWTEPIFAALKCIHHLHGFVGTEQSPSRRDSIALTHLLSLTHVFEKSEPRDGVFALLGILDPVVSSRSMLPVSSGLWALWARTRRHDARRHSCRAARWHVPIHSTTMWRPISFLGSAYIHNITLDESLKRRLEDGEAKEETFTLC